MNWALVFLGGGIGSLFRFAIAKWFSTNFPLATLTANVFSSFILGIVVYFFIAKNNQSESLRLFWAVGFCGGFSTFSTFSLEVFSMLNKGEFQLALITIFSNLLLCVAAIAIAFYFSK